MIPLCMFVCFSQKNRWNDNGMVQKRVGDVVSSNMGSAERMFLLEQHILLASGREMLP